MNAPSPRDETSRSLIGIRLVAAGAIGWVLFTPPILTLAAGPSTSWGIPSLVVYLYGLWADLIALIALTLERRRD